MAGGLQKKQKKKKKVSNFEKASQVHWRQLHRSKRIRQKILMASCHPAGFTNVGRSAGHYTELAPPGQRRPHLGHFLSYLLLYICQKH